MLTGLLFELPTLRAQTESPASDTIKLDSTEEKKEVNLFLGKTSPCTVYEGLFNLYQDTSSGKLYMEIKEEQLGREYIHFSYTENGLRTIPGFRAIKGAYGSQKIFTIRKYYQNIEFNWVNIAYYFDPENPLSRAADANIAHPIFASEKIIARKEDSPSYLIEADGLFLDEVFSQIKFTTNDKDPFKLGNLNKTKTKYHAVRNYPYNSDVVVDYIFDNKHPTNFGSAEVLDARSVALRIQHSLVAVPVNEFEPRYDDPRIGFFTHQSTDQTSTDVTPYRDVIHRWYLRKIHPDSNLSEPLKPIVFWIENTTPLEIRPWIQEGVEAWNIAFEQAGFKNAVVVKQQPDDADWEAGDIRYNVLRWVSSPSPAYSGYGPSMVNPRTGQILGADIMFEFVALKNRIRETNLYTGDTRSMQSFMDLDHGDAVTMDYDCELSLMLQDQFISGNIMMDALGFPDEDKERLLEEYIKHLALHEVGHTLGLNHNFKASQLWSPDEINNMVKTSKEGLTSSVMDYTLFNLASSPDDQGQFYGTVPGYYDRWAIEYGYSEGLKDPVAENGRLDAITSRSTDPKLAFGNDGDDMRSPGKGIDPRANVYDNTNDAITYAINRMDLIRKTMTEVTGKLLTQGESYEALIGGYYRLLSQYNIANRVTTRYIGGVYVDRSFVGQEGAGQPLTPVSEREQRRAMNALTQFLFAPGAFDVFTEVLPLLLRQRRGFSHARDTEDPKLHQVIMGYQMEALAHLLHPTVCRRLVDTELYGNTYQVAEMMSDLTQAVFRADVNTDVKPIRQNLQHVYTGGLISILDSSRYDFVTQSAALSQLKTIKKMLRKTVADKATQDHRDHLKHKIEKALDKS